MLSYNVPSYCDWADKQNDKKQKEDKISLIFHTLLMSDWYKTQAEWDINDSQLPQGKVDFKYPSSILPVCFNCHSSI